MNSLHLADEPQPRGAWLFLKTVLAVVLNRLGYYTMLAMNMNVGRTTLLDGRLFRIDPTPLQLKSVASNPLRG